MQVNILLFATLKERAGKSRLVLDIPDDNPTILAVRQALSAAYPDMDVNVELAIAALNQEFAVDTDVVKSGDEIAFFPPVSGGNYPTILQLTEEPVDHNLIIAQITTPQTGAVCLFSGIVRAQTDKTGHLAQTTALEYEAYEPMALAKMRQVADEIRARWSGVLGIAVIQRIGKMAVGENTVLIACSSAHRDDGCFEAARYGIDRLKQIVPVWKKEIGSDGAVWITGEYIPTSDDNPLKFDR